jgi:hypothetical protein
VNAVKSKPVVIQSLELLLIGIAGGIRGVLNGDCLTRVDELQVKQSLQVGVLEAGAIGKTSTLLSAATAAALDDSPPYFPW